MARIAMPGAAACLWLWAAWAAGEYVPSAEAVRAIEESITPARLDESLRMIGDFGPRSAGSPGLSACGEWLHGRLSELGLDVLPGQLVDVAAPIDLGCRLRYTNAQGVPHSLPVYGLWPNLAALPSLPDGRIEARLVYCGKGRLADFDGNPVGPAGGRPGAIVLMDYDSQAGWEQAAALGAAAVVFGPAPRAVLPENSSKLSSSPLTFPRLYLDDPVGWRSLRDLARQADARAVLEVGMAWRQAACRNITAVLPATEPAQHTQTILISAPYDAFSVAPGHAIGGKNAGNVAAVLAMIEALSKAPIARRHHLMVLFDSPHGLCYEGARAFCGVLRDLHVRRRAAIEAEGGEPAPHERIVLEKLWKLEPWLDEKASALDIRLGRVGAALSWLEQCRDGVVSFEYTDPMPVEISLDIRYPTARRWLEETVKDVVKQQQIATIVEVQALENAAGIDMFTPNDEAPEAVRHARLRRGYYRDVDAAEVLEDVLAMMQRHAHRDLLDPSDATPEYLTNLFSSLHRELSRRREGLASSLALREALEPYTLTRHLLIDLSSGNNLATLALARYIGGAQDPSAGMEWPWSLGPLVSQVSERIAAQGNHHATEPGGAFRFVDSITFNAARKLQVAPAGRSDVSYSDANVEFAQTGISPFALVTGNDPRIHVGGPGDRLPKAEQALRNIELQAQTGALLLAALLEDPEIFPHLEKNVPDVINVRGAVVRKDVRAGPFPRLPVPDSVVVLPSSQLSAEGIAMCRYALAASDGGFGFRGIPAGRTHILYSGASLQAFRFREQDGSLSHAIDAMMQQRGGYSAHVSNTGSDVFRRLVVFEGAPVRLYGLTDPMSLQMLGRIEPIDETGGALEYLYTSLSRSLSPNAMLLVPPDAVLKLLVYRSGKYPSMLLLGAQESDPTGSGYPVDGGLNLVHTVPEAARCLSVLNESRLDRLAAKGVRSALASRLHDSATAQLPAMEQALESQRYSEAYSLARGIWGRELRAYPEIRGIANQALFAVVLLLALLAPWAVFMERMTIQAGNINWRIAGTTGYFTAAFVLIFFLHPAFQISKSPIIILVAYTLAGLAALAFAVIFHKYSSVMRRWRERVGGVHASDISRASAFAVAFSLGLTNLAKRPLRTALTLVMLALLAFAVMTFTSVEAYLDTRLLPMPTEREASYNGLMFRQSAWTTISSLVAETFEQDLGPGATAVRRLWYLREEGPWAIGIGSNRFVFSREEDERHFTAECLQSFAPNEGQVSDLPNLVAGQWFTGARDEVILPTAAAQALGVGAEDVADVPPSDQVRVTYGAHELRVIGILDSRKADAPLDPFSPSLSHVDFFVSGFSPDDFRPERMGEETRVAYMGFDRTVLLSQPFLQDLGGKIKTIAVRLDGNVDAKAFLDDLMSRLDINIFAALDGKTYLVKTARSQSVSGLWKLITPVILVVLIIVNTMLGAVDERREEIRMLGAVGLAPRHVSILYLAEASVYGVLSVVYGALLGLAAGLATRALDLEVNVNYAAVSTMLMGGLFIAILIAATWIPARRAARMATPSGAEEWALERSGDGRLALTLPFTMTRDNGIGIFAFLHEYFAGHEEPTSAEFCCEDLQWQIEARGEDDSAVVLRARTWLAPYDMRVGQDMVLELRQQGAAPLYRVNYAAVRFSGELDAWERAGYVFLDRLRQQFLIYRALRDDLKEGYVDRARAALAPHSRPETEGAA